MKRGIGRLCIAVGIIILLIPTIGNLYTRYKQDAYYKKYEEKNKALEETFQGLQDEEDASGIDSSGSDSQSGTGTPAETGEVIGLISIPKIDSELLLIEGARKDDLKIGAGHMAGTAMPGERGNCAVAGHRSYTFAKMWNRLNEVAVGDEIIIMQGNIVYTYGVDQIFIVEPSEVWVLEPEKDKHSITLITCEPVMKATHRLIVRGTLK